MKKMCLIFLPKRLSIFSENFFLWWNSLGKFIIRYRCDLFSAKDNYQIPDFAALEVTLILDHRL